jgi:hypothetical protein
MGDVSTHAGGCHCGKVRYEVKLNLGMPAISCNCSMCGRSGTLLSFVPATHFKLLTISSTGRTFTTCSAASVESNRSPGEPVRTVQRWL